MAHRPLFWPDTSSQNAYSTVKRWMAECLSNHNICSQHTVADLPKRIIEIDGDHAYLRESKDLKASYACLSHCWGKNGAALQLTNATIDRLKRGIVKQLLPNTFRDALEICTQLGIKFLWIDAICKFHDKQVGPMDQP
jgi:hypothetical protein